MTEIEALAARITASPFNSWLGLRPIEVDETGVTLEMETRPEMLGNLDTQFVHGGVIGAVIDAACSYAWLARAGGFVSTIDLRIDFHRPMPSGLIRVRGDIVRAGRRIVTADARVTDTTGQLLSSGRAVMMPSAG